MNFVKGCPLSVLIINMGILANAMSVIRNPAIEFDVWNRDEPIYICIYLFIYFYVYFIFILFIFNYY